MKSIKDSLFIVFLLAAFAVQLPLSIFAAYCTCVLYAAINFRRVKVNNLALTGFLVVFIFFLIGGVASGHGLSPLIYLILTPFLFMAARAYASRDVGEIVAGLRNAYWMFALVIAALLVVYREEIEPLGAIFPWSSTNGIPSYLIVLQSVYAVAYYLKDKKLPIVSAFALVIVSYYGIGRGAIVISLLVFAFSVAVNMLVSVKAKKLSLAARIALALILSSLFVVLGVGYLSDTFSQFVESTRLSGGLFDEHRWNMLLDYLDKLDGVGFLIGQNYEGTVIDSLYGGNPHNSLIRLHSFYGIFPLILVMLSIFLIVPPKRDWGVKTVFAIFWLFLMMRALTEPIFFPTPLDFFYVLMFFLFFEFNSTEMPGGRLG
jgi:hypothetical protein